jgi:hypothetical protein
MIMSCFQNCGVKKISEAAMYCTGDLYLHMGAPPGKRPRLNLTPFTNVDTFSVERDVKSKLREF